MTVSTKLPLPLTSARKIVSPDGLRHELSKIRAAATCRPTIVLATGKFHLLHVGHVSFLERAAALGHILVVGVCSGGSFAKSPVLDGQVRARMVAALGCVDFVIQIDHVVEERLVKAVTPDVLVVGCKKRAGNVAGIKYVEKRGGHVVVLDKIDSISTTTIVESIIQNGNQTSMGML